MIKAWVIYSVLACLLWGVFPIFQKSSLKWVDPVWAYLFSTVGATVTTLLLFLFFRSSHTEIHSAGALFGILSGISGSLGVFFFLLSLSRGGKASIIVPFTALYPVISIILGLILFKETISLAQGIGIILALISVFLLSL